MRLNVGNWKVDPGVEIGQKMHPCRTKGRNNAANITAAATSTTTASGRNTFRLSSISAPV